MSCLPRRVLSSLLIFVVLKRCQTSFISITRTAARRISSGWLVHYFDHLNLCASIRYSCLSCFILTLLILICLSVSFSFIPLLFCHFYLIVLLVSCSCFTVFCSVLCLFLYYFSFYFLLLLYIYPFIVFLFGVV